MSAHKERPDAMPTPDAAGLIDAYFSRLRLALPADAAGDREETVEDLRAQALEDLDGGGDVELILASFGAPEGLAARFAEAAREEPPGSAARKGGSVLSGRAFGMPYDLRPPTAERLASRTTALMLPVGMTLLGVVLAVGTWIRRRPPLLRAASGALALSLAALSIGAYGQLAAAARGGNGLIIMFAGLAASLLLPFALLVVLSRIGRAAEQHRDLNAAGKGDL